MKKYFIQNYSSIFYSIIILIFLQIKIFPEHLFKNELSQILFYQNKNETQLDSQKIKKYEQVADTLVKTLLVEQKGYKLLGELCQIGPRLSGSENSMKAINWAKNKMEELGFDTVYLQPVMVPHWKRGNIEELKILNYHSNQTNHLQNNLSIKALGGSVGTDTVKGLKGKVIEIHSFDELKNLGNAVKDKFVFFNIPFNQKNIITFYSYGELVRYRVVGAIEAAKYGAKGIIIRSISTRNDNNPHTGNLIYNDTIPEIPAVAIGIQDADFLSELIKDNKNLELNLKLSCKTFPDVLSYNVIAEKKGTEFPDEVIVVSGHFDSWDIGQGAHDDGQGCMQALEVIDVFNRLNIQPKRTIRAIFYINEENGGKGGKRYAEVVDSLFKEKEEFHLAAIESDAGAFTPRGFTVNADTNIIEKMNSWLPLFQDIGINWFIKGGGGADINFIKNIKAKIGYMPDSQRYFDYHHSANDKFSEVNAREFELGTAAIALLTYLISEEGL